MRAVVQRVSEASVEVDGAVVGATGPGFLVLLGVEEGDTSADADYLAEKIAGLRVFNDADGKMNLSLGDTGGGVLLISQFTLHGDCRRGKRPSFITAARPETAVPLYERTAERLRARGVPVATGVFGAHMAVRLVNDGPVTLLLDSRKGF
ncbi:MAG: D-tyrosyl-tRNA(Tyr) deacylase [Candidatus Hydrogenedentes bacterium]|nr:D-tyrosyl-tRNA(Tyr) deacylase [Candidatus Hydrogenedentota bacterium]